MSAQFQRQAGALTFARGGGPGFSLIEVVVSLALLGIVLLTIAGTFVQGASSIETAKDLTEAASLATGICEEMEGWGFSETYSRFGFAEEAGAFSLNSLTNSFACKWQEGINARLPDAKAKIEVSPVGGGLFASAKGIRTTVTIEWTRKVRPRSVSIVRVRF